MAGLVGITLAFALAGDGGGGRDTLNTKMLLALQEIDLSVR